MATLQEILAKAQKAGKSQQEIEKAAKIAGVSLPAAGAKMKSSIDQFASPKPQQVGANAPYSFDMQQPTVATKTSPVVDRTMQEGFAMPDFSDIEGMDQTGLQDYLDSVDIRLAQGEQLGTDELLKARRAARMMQTPQGAAVNPYEQSISELRAEQERMRAELGNTSNQLLEDRRQLLEQQFEQARAEAQRLGDRQKDAVQNRLSFSGFGRSTFAADQANEIERSVAQTVNLLQQAKNAELAAYQAELQGADQDTLDKYQDQVRQYQIAAQQRENQAIMETNAMNKEFGVSFEERINNLIQASQNTAKSFADLTEDEKGLISSYATVLLDNEGNVDDKVLAAIPAGLSAYVIQEAARIKGGLGGGEAAETVTVGTGKAQRRYQWNPETQRYDIIVGGGGGAGGGFGGGGGIGGGTVVGSADPQEVAIADSVRGLLNIGRNDRLAALGVLGGITGALSPTYTKAKADYDFIKENLTLDNFLDARAKGGTFGSMSEGEWKIIANAASKLKPGLPDSERQRELNRIQNTLGEAAQRSTINEQGQVQEFTITPDMTDEDLDAFLLGN